MTDFPTPQDILPHRDPFLFIDEIIELTPAEYARGRWRIDESAFWVPGHFPGRPTLPGVLMCEAIGQMGAYTVLTSNLYQNKIPMFGGLDKARFRKQVVPGDTVEVEAHITKLSARSGKGYGKVFVNDAVACSADVMFVVVDK